MPWKCEELTRAFCSRDSIQPSEVKQGWPGIADHYDLLTNRGVTRFLRKIF
jgi:hypothetical protein